MLENEVEFLNNLQKKEERLSQLFDLGFSMLAFTTFWLVGAVVFMVTEGWSYGISVYFWVCMCPLNVIPLRRLIASSH
jgi:hypothetical protein